MPLPNAPPSPQLPQNPNPKPNPPSIAIPVELTHLPFWGALRLLPACANTTGHIPIPTPVDMRGEIATLLEWCARARVGKEMTSAVLMRDLVDAATRDYHDTHGAAPGLAPGSASAAGPTPTAGTAPAAGFGFAPAPLRAYVETDTESGNELDSDSDCDWETETEVHFVDCQPQGALARPQPSRQEGEQLNRQSIMIIGPSLRQLRGENRQQNDETRGQDRQQPGGERLEPRGEQVARQDHRERRREGRREQPAHRLGEQLDRQIGEEPLHYPGEQPQAQQPGAGQHHGQRRSRHHHHHYHAQQHPEEPRGQYPEQQPVHPEQQPAYPQLPQGVISAGYHARRHAGFQPNPHPAALPPHMYAPPFRPPMAAPQNHDMSEMRPPPDWAYDTIPELRGQRPREPQRRYTANMTIEEAMMMDAVVAEPVIGILHRKVTMLEDKVQVMTTQMESMKDEMMAISGLKWLPGLQKKVWGHKRQPVYMRRVKAVPRRRPHLNKDDRRQREAWLQVMTRRVLERSARKRQERDLDTFVSISSDTSLTSGDESEDGYVPQAHHPRPMSMPGPGSVPLYGPCDDMRGRYPYYL